MNPVEFRNELDMAKTRVLVLSSGDVIVMLALFVARLWQTDGRTDEQRDRHADRSNTLAMLARW